MARVRRLLLGALLAWQAAAIAAAADPPNDATRAVLETPGLVAFWTFGEEAGQPRRSHGTRQLHPLAEVNGPIPRIAGGPYSGWAAELNGKQFFSIPYAQTGDLNICGPEAQVSLFAVVRIVDLEVSRTIAGMWSEGAGAHDDSGTRQYALLMNMPTYGGRNRLTPHISSEGGVTRRADGTRFPWCVDYAVTQREVPTERWCTLAFTYDGQYIRAYIDGVLDVRQLDPRADRRTDPYFAQGGPAGTDRGMNPYFHGRGIYCFRERDRAAKPRGGSDFVVGARYALGSTRQATKGRFAGLAVFARALSDAEIRQLHQLADVGRLP
ncbi:MAG: hypothetical protein JNG90_01690 [Planctomycetaceae bacterium]|nr:hypothetical protein [Planctomycetaceae bacterium]